jgi:hypothetical protein
VTSDLLSDVVVNLATLGEIDEPATPGVRVLNVRNTHLTFWTALFPAVVDAVGEILRDGK